MVRRKGFNWKGIEDNGDGTYVTDGKIEKRRLLKTLHSQGVSVRSKRNSDGSWSVAAIGTIRQTKRRASQVGYRPQTRRIAQVQGRYVPVGRNRHMIRPVRVSGPIPNAYSGMERRRLFTPEGKPKSPSVLQKYIDRRKTEQGQNQRRIEESKKVEAEMAARSTGPNTRIRTQQEIIEHHNQQRMQRAVLRDEQKLKIDQSALANAREEEIKGE